MIQTLTKREFVPSALQTNIFDHVQNSSNSLAICATAGSGKTTTVVKASALLDPLDFTGFLAFNKSVATELQSRLPSYVHTSTFHSIGMRSLRSNLRDVNVNKNKYWDIARQLSRGDRTFGGLFTSYYPLIQLLGLCRMCRTRLTVGDVLRLCMEQNITGITAAGDQWNEVIGVIKDCIRVGIKQAMTTGDIDFTDMVWLPLFKGWVAPEFNTLFIDEAQDLNKVQLDYAKALVAEHGKVVAVGDRDQAIYAFTGALSDSFDKVSEAFNADELPLSVCYRCPLEHITLARLFCSVDIQPRDNAPAGSVDYISPSSLVTELSNKDNALLICRRKAPLLENCVNLLRQGVSAKIVGDDVVEKIVKLLKMFQSGYGATYKTLPGVMDSYLVAKGEEIVQLYGESGEGIVNALIEDIEAINTVVDAFDHIKSINGLIKEIEKLTKGKASVRLSTIHKAKGLESDWVGILEYNEEPSTYNFMTDVQMQQERNLQFIALTRSKQNLRLIEA